MPKKPQIIEAPLTLRRRAEVRVAKSDAKTASLHGNADARVLLHELEVHQIELEMQNEELRVARDEAEAMLEKYTDLYDFAPVSYFTLTDDGTVRLANLTASVLVGVERSKLIGRSLSQLLTPDHRPIFKDFLKRVFASSCEQSSAFVLAGKDPAPRIIEIEAKPSPDGLECSAVVVDITARRQAELTSLRLAAIVESSEDAIIGEDLKGIITDWNKGAEAIFGYSEQEMVGSSVKRLIPADRPLEENQILSRIGRRICIEHFETLRLTKSGKLIHISITASPIKDANGKVVGVSKVSRDISERRKLEEVVHRNEALFSTLVTHAPSGIYVVDSNFSMLQINPMAMPVFKNVHSLIGRDFSEIMRLVWPRRTADRIIARFRHTLKSGETYRTPSFAERRRDTGLKEDYEWQIQRVILPAGEYGVVCFFTDITERVRAETAQRRLDVLTSSNLKLKEEIVRRKKVEEDLRATRQEQSQLLKQSRLQQKQMRNLSHRILEVQEDERKRVSRELHDVIAQTLVGINVHLAALTHGATAEPGTLQQQIHRTQLLVESAVDTVHHFARELRPTILDDLGLIPALRTFLEGFMADTGIRASLKSFAGIEKSTATVRTVLYRIAQEALTNVARHAKARQVDVSIEAIDGTICMKIHDDGQGFEIDGQAADKHHNRLGLLGMKERIEMIGGTFHLKTAPGHPTTVQVRLPAARNLPPKPVRKNAGHAT